jgi:hypothetical protein
MLLQAIASSIMELTSMPTNSNCPSFADADQDDTEREEEDPAGKEALSVEPRNEHELTHCSRSRSAEAGEQCIMGHLHLDTVAHNSVLHQLYDATEKDYGDP